MNRRQSPNTSFSVAFTPAAGLEPALVGRLLAASATGFVDDSPLSQIKMRTAIVPDSKIGVIAAFQCPLGFTRRAVSFRKKRKETPKEAVKSPRYTEIKGES